MPITNHFYNSSIKKYIALFGTIFNKIYIERSNLATPNVAEQRMIVPIAYGPHQKFLSRITQDPKLDKKPAIILPRMAFEISGISYDGPRKVTYSKKIRGLEGPEFQEYIYSGAPYDIEFTLSIISKYREDGAQIVEQILPFFKPEFTTTVKLIKDIEPFDVPLILNSVANEDLYEGSYEERSSVIWTLNFTMKAWFFGPVRDKGLIKFVDVSMFDGLNADRKPFERITVQPGLTANGEPTSNIDETIPYTEINIDDDWGIITIIEEFTNDE